MSCEGVDHCVFLLWLLARKVMLNCEQGCVRGSQSSLRSHELGNEAGQGACIAYIYILLAWRIALFI